MKGSIVYFESLLYTYFIMLVGTESNQVGNIGLSTKTKERHAYRTEEAT